MFGLLLLFIGQSIIHVSCKLALLDNKTVFDYGDHIRYYGTFISPKTQFTGQINVYNNGFSNIKFYFASCLIEAKWNKSDSRKEFQILYIQVEETRVVFSGEDDYAYDCDIGFIETDDNTNFAIKVSVSNSRLVKGLVIEFDVPFLDEHPKVKTKNTTIKTETKNQEGIQAELIALFCFIGVLFLFVIFIGVCCCCSRCSKKRPVDEDDDTESETEYSTHQKTVKKPKKRKVAAQGPVLIQQPPIQQLPVQQLPVQQLPVQQTPIQQLPLQQLLAQQPTPQIEQVKMDIPMSNNTPDQSAAVQASSTEVSNNLMLNFQSQQGTAQLPTEPQTLPTMNAANQDAYTLHPSNQQSLSNVQPSQYHRTV
ncbi:hypothetical protein M3Y96_00408100 [Aphelenchoides besseyi]|nr:hypothetical protein M3Y96_00408100 [Aphelenchoides besseyi]